MNILYEQVAYRSAVHAKAIDSLALAALIGQMPVCSLPHTPVTVTIREQE